MSEISPKYASDIRSLSNDEHDLFLLVKEAVDSIMNFEDDQDNPPSVMEEMDSYMSRKKEKSDEKKIEKSDFFSLKVVEGVQDYLEQKIQEKVEYIISQKIQSGELMAGVGGGLL